mmetsp:Transcript_1566/g.2365  ORF Transcript_1566/g.2365 Transcript_1566/m.2365 type:complete len:89 (+) Transcript_1566:121-387(+)
MKMLHKKIMYVGNINKAPTIDDQQLYQQRQPISVALGKSASGAIGIEKKRRNLSCQKDKGGAKGSSSLGQVIYDDDVEERIEQELFMA